MRRARTVGASPFEKLQSKVRTLPPPIAKEVLSFIDYLEYRRGRLAIPDEMALMSVQEEARGHVLDNPEDELWNNVPTR
ncbi:hypothetical protein [Candidatus Magnetaquicoccus inordinatus]|uniref:hypothetical protein n=1 Tax=Candidatus Magnetaquicoccus inordinatus TaxID=2496818 RepID=UPI00102C32C6|nr:hypothetical protein [Candidatus Magnetaquicoccus inordinatus]